MPQIGWQFIGIVHDKDVAILTQLFAEAKIAIQFAPVVGRVHEQRLLVQAGKKQRAEWLMDRSFYRSRHGHGDND